MRDEHAERIKDDCRSMLSGALGMDQIAESIELEVGSYNTAHIST